jgi:hypothetical protein
VKSELFSFSATMSRDMLLKGQTRLLGSHAGFITGSL